MVSSRHRDRALLPSIVFHLLVPGCLPVDTLDITFPEGEPAKAILVSIQTRGKVRVFAYARGEGGGDGDAAVGRGQRIQLPAHTSSEIELLLYEETLLDLGVGRGEILPSSGSTSQPVPMPRAIYASRVQEGALSDWAPRGEMSDGLSAFRASRRVSMRSPCVSFVARSLPIPIEHNVEFAIALPDGALVGGGDSVVHVTEDGPRAVPVEPAGLRFSGGFAEASGDVWLSSEPNRLYRGVVAETLILKLAGESGSERAPRWLDLDRRTDGAEMFSLTRFGDLELWSAQRGQLLYAFPSDHSFSGGVARTGPHEAVAVRSGVGNIVIRYREGVISEEPVDGGDNGFSAAAQIPGLGTIVGSGKGDVFRSGEGTWQSLGKTGFSGRILSIVPFGEGFVLGGEFGFIGQYSPSSGFCPVQLVLQGSVFYMARLGDGILAVPRDSEQGIVAATLLSSE